MGILTKARQKLKKIEQEKTEYQLVKEIETWYSEHLVNPTMQLVLNGIRRQFQQDAIALAEEYKLKRDAHAIKAMQEELEYLKSQNMIVESSPMSSA